MKQYATAISVLIHIFISYLNGLEDLYSLELVFGRVIWTDLMCRRFALGCVEIVVSFSGVNRMSSLIFRLEVIVESEH